MIKHHLLYVVGFRNM